MTERSCPPTRTGACRSTGAGARDRAARSSSGAARIASVPLTRKIELASGSQQSGGLGYPGVRIRPDGRPVLGDGQVEARVRKRNRLRARLEKRKLEPETHLHLPRRLELGRGDVDSNRPRAATRQPGGDVGRAAPELDHVEPSHRLRQHPHLGLGNPPHAPQDLLGCPGGRGASAANSGPRTSTRRGCA